MRKKNEQLIAEIIGYENSGMGVAKVDGDIIFVKNAVRGDRCLIHILKAGKINYAKVVQVIQPAEGRSRKEVCPHAFLCGGCDLWHMTAEEEKFFKIQKVEDAISRIGRIQKKVDEYIEDDNYKYYRNKAIFPVVQKGEELAFGFFRKGSHDVVDIKECWIQSPQAVEIAKTVLEWMNNCQITAYNENTGKGKIRQVYVRSNSKGQFICTIVSTDLELPSIEKLIDLLIHCCPNLVGILLNLNETKGNTLLGDQYRLIWGKDYLEDDLCGKRIRISPAAFYQINHRQAEKLYQKAIEYGDLRENEDAMDLYCGIGTITLLIAEKVKNVIGIEINPQSISDAKKNAALNNVNNIRFEVSDAGKGSEKYQKYNYHPSAIFVDPPRKGLDELSRRTILQMNPSRIVYISCDPATLARDLAEFCDNSYEVKKVAVVNMFPRTKHVETVVLLCRKHEAAEKHLLVEYDTDGRHMDNSIVNATYSQIKEWVAEHYNDTCLEKNLGKRMSRP